MTRKKIISKKEFYVQYKDSLNELNNTPSELSHAELADRAGGSISNLPVVTTEFKEWLGEHQKLNPFIGKHVQAAPEYNTEYIKYADDKIIEGDEASEIVKNSIDQKFDPTNTSGPLVDDILDSIKSDDNHDDRFIDMVIIENTTRLMLNHDKENIIFKAEDAIRKYRGDDTYKSDMDIGLVVDQTEILLIEESKQKLLLK